MNILIVDDEPLAVKRLDGLIEKIPGCHSVGNASDGVEAVYKAYKLGIDIVLMDISLPRMNGLEAARHIREFEHPPMIVFTTAYPDHALDAFALHAASYLIKPVRLQDLLSALNFIQNTCSRKIHEPVFHGHSEPDHICCRNEDELHLVALNGIYYLESFKKFTRIIHKDGISLTEKPLKEFISEFPQRLIQVHRGMVINKAFLVKLKKTEVNRYEIQLQDINRPIPVSRRHLPAIRRHLKSFMLSAKIIRRRENKMNDRKPL